MATKFAIAFLLFVSFNSRAFSNDTIVVSYEKPFVSVASVYTDLVIKITKDEEGQMSFLNNVDALGFRLIKKEIDSIAHSELDPNKISIYVKKYANPKFESNYIRFVFTQMMNKYLGFRTPLEIKMVFNASGYLSWIQFSGFEKLNDGFILNESILLSSNRIHKSQLKKFGI